MSFLKNPYVAGTIGLVLGMVAEKKFGVIARIPVVRDWLA